ncbi:MAG: putative endonuclease distantly related to archaeal Holliday junction resolvase [Labilithrix sp.]|nr:putative endonuclease distantly related to archaeal Holliday junction resolvase [Labilithrix sp.]
MAAEKPRVARSSPLPARHQLGRDAETLAAQTLVRNGFRILWRNVRIGALEVDIVAKKADLVVVVEVRARGPGSFEKPLASISVTKRRLLLRAVRALWRGRLKKMPEVRRVRIDVAAVTEDEAGAPVLEWIAGAFTENDV